MKTASHALHRNDDSKWTATSAKLKRAIKREANGVASGEEPQIGARSDRHSDKIIREVPEE